MQVCSLYDTKEFPALRTAPAQAAMVQLVEREGYTTLISEVFTEETTLDETLLKVFQAFLRMVELKHSTVEEILPLFVAEDFIPTPWETEHVSQVICCHFLASLKFLTQNLKNFSNFGFSFLQTVTEYVDGKVEVTHTFSRGESEKFIYLSIVANTDFHLTNEENLKRNRKNSGYIRDI